MENLIDGKKYDIKIFKEDLVKDFSKTIFKKNVRGQEKSFVKCIIRDKDIQLKPEEIVRQLYTSVLINEYNYPKKLISFEHPINFGREVKSADIVIFDKEKTDAPFIIVELKKPKLKDGKEQLKSYCNATGAPIGIWTNGSLISQYNRKDPNYFEELTRLPTYEQTLEDVLSTKYTLKSLFLNDRVSNQKKALKDIVLEMEDEVLANAGVDVFEEVFKLLFVKLYDEYLSRRDRLKIQFHIENNLDESEVKDFSKVRECINLLDDSKFRLLEFRNTGQTETQLYEKIQNLFEKATEQWMGVFPSNSKFELSGSHLAVCVSSIQDIKLFNSNLLVIDEAFEYLIKKSSKGEKGQYFTPRHVIDMCIEMISPEKGEYVIDTASGSCGFPVHAIFKMTGKLFSNTEISEEDKDAIQRVFGIDFDEKTVRVARTLNLIAGDGETNVLHLNTLDYTRWNEKTEKNTNWINTYGKGFERLKKLRSSPNQNKDFNFDIVLANPPFAGDIKESRILHQYELGFKKNGKIKSKVSRDILFIERNLDFLKPGGRMAIVLPQGLLNNPRDLDIRNFICEKARIIAVIGLGINTFKPHTGTKTSVVILQKWDDKICPYREEYPIFFGVSNKSGKNNSGDYVYFNDNSEPILDRNGHLIVDHDLHSHNGELQKGIAEEFSEWCKNNKISFSK